LKVIGTIGTTGQVFFISTNGHILSTGYNQYGLSGLGSQFNFNFMPLPMSMPNDLTFVDGAVSNAVACFISTNRTQLWCLGQNQFGQLGVGSISPATIPFFGSSYTRIPVRVALPSNVAISKVVITGSTNSEAVIALTTSGSLLSWGFNGNYILGDGTTTNRASPNYVKATSSSFLLNVVDVVANPEGNSWAVALVNPLATYSGAPIATCSSNCNCGSGGCDVYSWGNLGNGNLGRAASAADQGYARPVTAKARSVALQGGNGGVGSTCIINFAASVFDSTISCWGYNGNGECGTGNTLTPNAGPLQAALLPDLSTFKASYITSNGGDLWGYYCAIRTTDVGVYCWGLNYFGNVGSGTGSSAPFASVLAPTKVVGFRYGTDTTWNYNITNVVTTPGRNNYGSPISSYPPYWTTCALRGDGTVWCWGYNGNGNLGNPGDTTSRNFAIQIPNLLNIVEIYLIGSDYNYHTLYAVESDRVTVWAIGYNGRYAVGDGSARDHQYPQRPRNLYL